MTHITLPRVTVEQALEALERARPLKADYTTPEYFEEAKRKHYAAMAALRAALAQQAEPVEPVAVVRTVVGPGDDGVRIKWLRGFPKIGDRLYTAAPQRKPLTDEEILDAVGWERAEMYMKLTPNFPVDEAKKETLKNARAVERALEEKNRGR